MKLFIYLNSWCQDLQNKINLENIQTSFSFNISNEWNMFCGIHEISTWVKPKFSNEYILFSCIWNKFHSEIFLTCYLENVKLVILKHVRQIIFNFFINERNLFYEASEFVFSFHLNFTYFKLKFIFQTFETNFWDDWNTF